MIGNKFILTQEDFYERTAMMFDVHSLFPNISYRAFKIIIMVWFVMIFAIKSAVEEKMPNLFIFALAAIGFYILLEILIRCYGYVNETIGSKYGFTKAFLVFLTIILIMSFY